MARCRNAAKRDSELFFRELQRHGGYLRDIQAMLGFIETKLNVRDLLTHPWVNGRAATPGDPWHYCLGCSLQTLYILTPLGGSNEDAHGADARHARTLGHPQ